MPNIFQIKNYILNNGYGFRIVNACYQTVGRLAHRTVKAIKNCPNVIKNCPKEIHGSPQQIIGSVATFLSANVAFFVIGDIFRNFLNERIARHPAPLRSDARIAQKVLNGFVAGYVVLLCNTLFFKTLFLCPSLNIPVLTCMTLCASIRAICDTPRQ